MKATYIDLYHKPVTREAFIAHLHAFADGAGTNERERERLKGFVDRVLVPNMDDEVRAQGLQP